MLLYIAGILYVSGIAWIARPGIIFSVRYWYGAVGRSEHAA